MQPRASSFPARCSLLIAALALLSCSQTEAIDLLVYNNNDNGAGSLRQALADNNGLGGGSTIIFSNIVTGTIALTSGDLLITKNVTIVGPGANVLAINGNYPTTTNRVFQITNSTVMISGLTIINGYAKGNTIPAQSGGGIFNSRSTLSLSNCILSGNSAVYGGGIFNSGYVGGASGSAALTVIACTFSGNSANYGGGIFNDGHSSRATLTVIASAFSGNSSSRGGGIYNDGQASGGATLTLTNCTFATNTASSLGGGIYNDSYYFGFAACALWSCTLSGNSATANGGGVFNYGTMGSATVTFANSILQGGASGANYGSTGEAAAGGAGHNLSSDNPGAWFEMLPGDQWNTDARLGPLKDNGGPTFTHAPLPNSPAIGKGKSFGLTTDQRGAPRPFDFGSIANANGGDGSDIGAAEVGQPKLNIQKLGTNAVLSWQAYYGNFTLQSVTTVTASSSWANVPGTPAVIANQFVVTNGPISSYRFYRLTGN